MFDVVIAGGGPVGTALAAALDDSALSVLLIEPRRGRSDDRRGLALSYGSRLILERIGAWDALTDCTPIESIHVSQQGGFGSTLMTAREAQVPALGYVTAYATLQAALGRRLEHARAQRRCAQLDDVSADAQQALACIATDNVVDQVACGLAVIADGGAAARAASLQETRDYRQCAVVAELATDPPSRARAFERFTPHGPIALLPAAGGYALVWTLPPSEAQRVCELPDAAFLAHLQSAFGYRAGEIVAASARAVYPLTLRRARATQGPRVVLIGNAAQTLHPVAGQGLNLGLRDAFALAQLLRARASTQDADLAARFQRERAADRRNTILLTDALVRGFSNHSGWLRRLRGCGLTLLDSLPTAKHAFMERMMFGG